MSEKCKYTSFELESFDKERHLELDKAYSLIDSQNDPLLKKETLESTIKANQIKVYEFKGQKYVDRLDIGKIYHTKKEVKEGLSFERTFTDGKTNPLESVEYETRKIELKGEGDKILFSMEDASFPASWNYTDSLIVAQKYFYKPHKEEWKQKLKNKIGKEYENSPKHLVTRITNFIADEAEKLNYFKTDQDKEIFKDELKWLQINRRIAFNSPVQFNAGLYNEYEVEGGSGRNYWKNPDTEEVELITDGCNKKPQCHACFIKGPRDDLESILMHVVDEGEIFSSGSGIGQDIGALRARDESLSGGGKASGSISFLKIYDDAAGTIKSGGKSRRAARMTTMRGGKAEAHPDITEFITKKVREDKKALVLMENGYSPGMDGEAYQTVTLQNTNLTVRLDDGFFDEVKNDGYIELRKITDQSVVEKIKARKLLKEIAFGAWRIGDPGIQYETTIENMNTCKNSGRINSSNPCSEFMFLDDTSCNLASLNLLEFSDEKGNFKADEFKKACKLTAIATDVLNNAASYPVKEIASVSPEFRCIGIGYANIGSMLMRKGLSYDSEEGRNFAASLTALMTGSVYEASAEMAGKLDTFEHYEFNKKPMNEVLKNHFKNLENIAWDKLPTELKEKTYLTWKRAIEKGEENGFRNAQASLLAPTGTISYLLGCSHSTGIEPAYQLIISKALAGGGSIKIVHSEIPNALRNLNYNEKQIKEISEYIVQNNKIIGAPHVSPDHYNIFDTANGNGLEGIIKKEGHIRMLGAVQPYLSGAISKTNNLPNTATVKDIYDAYLLGHELKLKALAVFRDDSKPTSPLGSGGKSYVKLKRGEKEDLPASRTCHEFEVGINNSPFHIIVSEYKDGRPGQIAFLAYKEGSTLGALLKTAGVSASAALKRGVSLEDALKGWIGQEFEPKGLVYNHPNIKTALSPLDAAAKIILLEYMNRTDLAEQPEKVSIEKLRGSENNAFETYRKMNIDEWNIDHVLADSELGGFVNENNTPINGNGSNGNGRVLNNERGVPCKACGKLMKQTGPNCYECISCGDKHGGCGA